jgi:uncharacterized protein YdeI (YjbR/CyaY-like superfamily)
MATTNPRVDAYIAKSADFAKPILNHLRKLVHQGCPETEEAIKWGMPAFMYRGKILCHLAAFKAHCAFGFRHGDLLLAKNKRIVNKEDKAMGQFGRITALADLPKDKLILELIREATKLANADVKPSRKPKAVAPRKELVVPSSLSAALKKNKEALATFEDFSYSHKKEYVEWITEAKTEETRNRRVETALEWMSEGKSRNWKYMKR